MTDCAQSISLRETEDGGQGLTNRGGKLSGDNILVREISSSLHSGSGRDCGGELTFKEVGYRIRQGLRRRDRGAHATASERGEEREDSCGTCRRKGDGECCRSRADRRESIRSTLHGGRQRSSQHVHERSELTRERGKGKLRFRANRRLE